MINTNKIIKNILGTQIVRASKSLGRLKQPARRKKYEVITYEYEDKFEEYFKKNNIDIIKKYYESIGTSSGFQNAIYVVYLSKKEISEIFNFWDKHDDDEGCGILDEEGSPI